MVSLNPDQVLDVRSVNWCSDFTHDEAFDELHFNAHSRGSGKTKSVAIFVHGFMGSGYETWQNFPKLLFDGGSHEQMDVAIFDYDSGVRTVFTRRSNLEVDAQRLVSGIRELAQHYSSLFFVCHSLGGILAENAIMKHLNYLSHAGDNSSSSKIAGLFVFASPRAGTGWAWANPVALWLVREFRWLRRFSDKTAEIEEFFTNHVQSRAVADKLGLSYLIPRFACLGSRDRIVNRFSAGFNIPTLQKQFLPGNHRSIAKPQNENSPQVVWLKSKIHAVNALRKQLALQLAHESSTTAVPASDDREIITELWHDTADADCTLTYNELLRVSNFHGIPVRDYTVAGVGQSRVDLLVSVHNANRVINDEGREHPRVEKARVRYENSGRLTVGIAPVGQEAELARDKIDGWLAPNRPTKHFFVEGANGQESLQDLTWLWLQSIVGRRNPYQRQENFRTMADRIIGLNTGIEDYYGKGYL
jgi:pimeloyl-ACP methyl ester carboxylesterase